MPSKNLILIYSAVVHSWAADILFPNAIFTSTGVVLCRIDFRRGFPGKRSPECSSHFLGRVPCGHEEPVTKPPKNLEKSYDRYPSEQAQGSADRWQLAKKICHHSMSTVHWHASSPLWRIPSLAVLSCFMGRKSDKAEIKILAHFCQAQQASLDAGEPKWRRRVPAARQSAVIWTIES